MTTPQGTEYRMVLAGADGKIIDSFLPDTVMPQAELVAHLAEIKKPEGGWPSESLASAVRASLAKADSALQSAPVASVAGKTGAVSLAVADLTDSSAVGRNVLTASSAAAARSAIGAGTSSLVLGTTAGTAAEATHTHAYSALTGIPATFTPAAHQHEIGHVNNLSAQLDTLSGRIDSHTHTSAALTDATTTGKALLTAASAAAARTAIGAGTSSLALGSSASTAKPGDWMPSAANLTDATEVGRAVLTAADPAAARTAIGAGTSTLELGTTATTAKRGDYTPTWTEVSAKPSTFPPSTHSHVISEVTGLQTALDSKAAASHTHTAAQLSDATATGRSLLTATDAAAARTAIGAGTSSLTIGTTASTAAAGNDSRLTNQRVPTDNSVSNVKIVDGAVDNAKISVNAAIALSKLAAGKGLGFVNGTPTDIKTEIVTEAQYAAYDAAAKADPTYVFLVRP